MQPRFTGQTSSNLCNQVLQGRIMKIVINAYSARRGGGQTYLTNLLKNIDSNPRLEVYIFADESQYIPNHPNIKKIKTNWSTCNPFFRTIWEKFILPIFLKKIKADVLFCPGGLVNTRVPVGCKIVTMFRNMIPFDIEQRKKYPFGYMRFRNWLLEKLFLKSMLKADLVIFISEYAKKVIENRIPIKLKKTVLIPHGINEEFKVSDRTNMIRPNQLPKEDYILYVSLFDVYKNQIEVVQAYNLLKERRKTFEKLVFVGFNDTQYGERVKKEILRLGLKNDIILLGNIDYKDLPSIYKFAKINIFASECENCPNILLEAMGAGRPLVVSNKPPMPEFGGDSAIYFNPRSPEDLCNKIFTIIDKPGELNGLSKKVFERSLLYDWKETSRKTWEALKSL
ncbi:MAG TPA: hypothetical protein DCP53_00470 [Elusimicrobia bacterium]|nr:hypothetical protein [Elusimicrobiota bacterium]